MRENTVTYFVNSPIPYFIRPGEYIWLFTRANILEYGHSPGRKYMPWRIFVYIRSDQYIEYIRPDQYICQGEYMWLFARTNILECGYSPG